MKQIDKNVLTNDLSPYLKQHKNNPVFWQTWSKETIDFAKQNSKPILLSIGYASCHWCHVMAHESFEDNETAKIMNEFFINIKVYCCIALMYSAIFGCGKFRIFGYGLRGRGVLYIHFEIVGILLGP